MALIGTSVQKAAEILNQGGLVAIPTETVYGLAANALNATAVSLIFEAKNRPFFDPLIVHIGHFDWLKKLTTSVDQNMLEFLNHVWPGPVSVLLPKLPIIPDITVAGSNKVALRMPKQNSTLELLNSLNFPLAAPSANPFGYISPTTAGHVQDQLGNKIPYILDGGPCAIGIESTIIEIDENTCTVLRLGGLDTDLLHAYFKTVHFNLTLNSNPKAPGMLDKHYSPSKNMQLFTNRTVVPKQANAVYIVIGNPLYNIPLSQQLNLSLTLNLAEAATNLFNYLRQADTMDIEIIYAEKVPDLGLGKAINDRLQRAAF